MVAMAIKAILFLLPQCTYPLSSLQYFRNVLYRYMMGKGDKVRIGSEVSCCLCVVHCCVVCQRQPLVDHVRLAFLERWLHYRDRLQV